VNGLGTVHHVARPFATGEEQAAVRDELIALGCRVTDIRDRCYFTSIYFREPGGVLFEIATVTPGFTVDEDLGALGRGLKLPPWEEPYRASIEANLPPVEYR
jgi:glyoxalase family protein